MLILYPETLLNSLIKSNSSSGDIFWDFIYKIMSFANRDNFRSFFLILILQFLTGSRMKKEQKNKLE